MELEGILKDQYEVLNLFREGNGFEIYRGNDIKEKKRVFLVSSDLKAVSSNIASDLTFWIANNQKPLLLILDQWIGWKGQILAFEGFEGINVLDMVESSGFPFTDEYLLPLVPRFLELCEALQSLQIVLPPPGEMLERVMVSIRGELRVFPLILLNKEEISGDATPFQRNPAPLKSSLYLELFATLCGYFATRTLPNKGLAQKVLQTKHISPEFRKLIVGCMEKYKSFEDLRKDLFPLMKKK